MKKILTLATAVLLVTSFAFAHGDDKKGKDKACCKKENKDCCTKDKAEKKEAKADKDKTAKPAVKKAA